MITFESNSGIYTLKTSQLLPITVQEAWDFFSDPENLAKITPGHMGFRITSEKPSKMYPGQFITYKVSPFPGLITNWVTEITQVQPKLYFVDEQRIGPYRMWHHEHRFEVRGNAVLMIDRVSYKLPWGLLGRLAHFLFVRNQLKRIFSFREKILEKLFGTK